MNQQDNDPNYCYEKAISLTNESEKNEWLEKAANSGDAIIQLRVGEYYINKLNNTQKGIYWLEKSAEQCDAKTQFELGKRYLYGDGIAKDFDKSVHWLEKAAYQGDSDLQFEIGEFYLEEHFNGIFRDKEKALYWIEKAAISGNAPAQFRLGNLYIMDAYDIPVNIDKSVFWLENAANNQKSENFYQYILGSFYADGRYRDGKYNRYYGFPTNQEKALYWLQKSGYLYELGDRYADGAGIPQDSKKAEYFLEKSTKVTGQKIRLGLRYAYGKGISKNPKKAVYWIEEAVADSNHFSAHAHCILGCFYADGFFFSRNVEKALEYLEKAAEKGNYNTQFELGRRYANGEGIPYDFDKAIYWLGKSNYHPAKTKLNAIRWLAETGYVDNHDDTITDTKAGLMWKKYCEGVEITSYVLSDEYVGMLPWHKMFTINEDCFLDTKWDYDWRKKVKRYANHYNWQEAMALVEQINKNGGFAGYTDWRIPTIDDLQSLKRQLPSVPLKSVSEVHSEYELCTLNTIFLCESDGDYSWSSSVKGGLASLFGFNKYAFNFRYSKHHWFIDTPGEVDDNENGSKRYCVRLVRDV